MLVFIDESGDSGFAVSRGSSKVFVLVCVVFEDELEAEKVSVALKELRRTLKLSETTEFKFNGSRKRIRLKFLEEIRNYKFKVRALVVRKKLIRSDQLMNDKNSFYGYFIKLILQHTRDTIINAKVRIDGSGDRVFRRNFQTYLRKQLNNRHKHVLQNIKMVNSKNNMLIQLADMIAGTIKRYKEGEKTDAKEYWRLIRNKVVDCWDFE